AAIADDSAFHQRPRSAEVDRMMLEIRIDIPQRREELLEELITWPASLLQRGFAPQVRFRRDDLCGRGKFWRADATADEADCTYQRQSAEDHFATRALIVKCP